MTLEEENEAYWRAFWGLKEAKKAPSVDTASSLILISMALGGA